MKLTAKELADEMNGIEYGRGFFDQMRKFASIAKLSELVIACGESDDLLKFYGSFRDEAGAYNGTMALIDSVGLLPGWDNASENEKAAERYFSRKQNAKFIEAVWCEEGYEYAWVLKTKIPHEVFSIMEDGEKFSRGIVFSIEDLKAN